MISKKKIKNIIKLNIISSSTSLDPKVSTILGQRRLNSSEIFNHLKLKISELGIKETVSVLLQVLIVVIDDDYIIYIKMPTLTTFVNMSLKTKKNFNLPGYLLLNKLKKESFNLILTPYILYEIVKYKLNYESVDIINIRSYYKKNISSLSSKGINILLNDNYK